MLHLTPDHDDVCCFVATTTAAIIAAIGLAGGTAAGSAIAAHGATKGADTAAKAANDAAAIKAKSDADALDFQKQQAEADWRNAESTRKANYDQSLARMDRLGSLYDILGMHRPSMPAYVPTQDPNLSGAPSGAPTAGPMAAPGAAGSFVGANGSTVSGDRLSAAQKADGSPASIDAFFKSQGAPGTETSYWVQQWPALVARGQQLGDPTYAAKRLAAADVFGGGASANTGSIAAMRSPVNNAMQATSLTAPALFQAPARVWGTM